LFNQWQKIAVDLPLEREKLSWRWPGGRGCFLPEECLKNREGLLPALKNTKVDMYNGSMCPGTGLA
jgi:hypothetical protein